MRMLVTDPSTGAIFRVISGNPLGFGAQIDGGQIGFALTDDTGAAIADEYIVVGMGGELEAGPSAPPGLEIPTLALELVA